MSPWMSVNDVKRTRSEEDDGRSRRSTHHRSTCGDNSVLVGCSVDSVITSLAGEDPGRGIVVNATAPCVSVADHVGERCRIRRVRPIGELHGR